MRMITCVIIEDEKETRQLLRFLLEKYCEQVEVLGEAGNVQDGVKIINEYQPELVFLDIAMPKENGFSLYKYFDEINFEVIFTTAFNQYAIRALKLAALDYLMKPINLEELMEALERLRKQPHRRFNKDNYSTIANNIAHTPKEQKIALACSDGYIFVALKDIIRCESERSYTLFIIKNQEPIWTSRNLGEYANILKDYGFRRVHRSHVINPNYIKKFVRGKNPVIIMEDSTAITIPSSKRNHVLKNLFIIP